MSDVCKPKDLCKQCAALLDECGQSNFDLYRKKLLIRGWAGVLSPVERAYKRKHRSAEADAAAKAAGKRLKTYGFATSPRSTDAGKA